MSHQSSLTISTGSRWYIDSIPIIYTQLVIWNNRKFWWSDFFDRWKSVYVNQHCSIAIVQRKSCWRKALQQGGFNNYLDRHAVHKTGAEECSNINLSYECLEVINHMELASSATYCHAMSSRQMVAILPRKTWVNLLSPPTPFPAVALFTNMDYLKSQPG